MTRTDLTTARNIDFICDKFEERLCSGEPPNLSATLSQVDVAQQALLLRELLAIEVEWKLSQSLPTVDDYLSVFPNERGLIENVFEEVFRQLPSKPPISEYAEFNSADIEFKQEIGRGGMGIILRGHDQRLGRDVAYKILHSELADSREARQRFEQEAKVCGRLEHPSIVPVHSLGRLPDGRPFFSMKLVEGTTLKDLLRLHRESISEQRLLDIFIHTCHAVGYAHACQVIHRDLKPENIMVGAFGEVQVMDWGLSKDVSIDSKEQPIRHFNSPLSVDQTRVGSIIGTPSYMSPEQANGKIDVVDARSDVYSLGVILGEILSGSTLIANRETACPFHDEESVAQHLKLIEARKCHPDLIAILRSCTDAAPENRPDNAAELANAIEHFREGVQERLRKAELQVAQEKARVIESAKRRRILFASIFCLVGMMAIIFSIVHARNQDRLRRLSRASVALKDAQNLFVQAASTGAFESPLWRHARRDAERASSLLLDQEPGTSLFDETTLLISQLDFILRLGAIHESESKTNIELNRFSITEAIPRYRQAFIEYGLRPDDAAEYGAECLKNFPEGAKLLLLNALNRCSQSSSSLQERHWWSRVSVCLDTDPWRKQVRDAIALSDHDKLLQCVFSVDCAQQPAFFLVQLADRLHLERHFEDAEFILRRAQMAHPNDFWVNHTLATLLAKKIPPQLGDAIRYHTTAVAIQKSAGALLNLGSTLMQAKRYGEAEDTLKESIALQPKYSYAYCFLAQAQIENGNLEEATTNIQEAGKLRQDTHHWHFTNAMLYFDREKYSKARPFLKEAAKLHPPLIDQIVRYGRTLFQRDEIADALSYMELATELKPMHPHTLYHLALMNQQIENLVEAERLYRQIIEIAPWHAEAHCNLGHTYRQRGEYSLALVWLKKGHQLGTKQRRWRYPSARWVAETEKIIEQQRRRIENK